MDLRPLLSIKGPESRIFVHSSPGGYVHGKEIPDWNVGTGREYVIFSKPEFIAIEDGPQKSVEEKPYRLMHLSS